MTVYDHRRTATMTRVKAMNELAKDQLHILGPKEREADIMRVRVEASGGHVYINIDGANVIQIDGAAVEIVTRIYP